MEVREGVSWSHSGLLVGTPQDREGDGVRTEIEIRE